MFICSVIQHVCGHPAMCKVLKMSTPQGTASDLRDISHPQITTPVYTYSLRQTLKWRGASEAPTGTGQAGKECGALRGWWDESSGPPTGAQSLSDLFLLQGVLDSSHGRQQRGQRHSPERGITIFHTRGGAGHRWHDHFRESEHGEKGLEWGVTAPVGVTHPQVAESRECQGGGLARPAPSLASPLFPGGGSPEPGSADHQRLKDHSAQTGADGGDVGKRDKGRAHGNLRKRRRW